MKSKILFLLIACTGIALAASSQSFFRPLPKKVATSGNSIMPGKVKAITDQTTTTVITASTMNAVRPIINFAAYSEPGHMLMAGGGIAYEHLKWDAAVEKWKAEWSVAAVMFGGGAIGNNDPNGPGAITYGILAGFYNNLINVGPTYNPKSKTVGIGVALGLNLNN